MKIHVSLSEQTIKAIDELVLKEPYHKSRSKLIDTICYKYTQKQLKRIDPPKGH